MKIVHISDTHQGDFTINLPKGDILIHTGDYSFLPKWASIKDKEKELFALNAMFGEVKNNYKHILFCPGNHDFMFEDDENKARSILSNVEVLLDSGITIDDINFYGTPSQPVFCDWAFNHSTATRYFKFDAIPEDTNVLLTHAPPYTILDLCRDGHVGDDLLHNRVQALQELKVHCFGHIHEGYGIIKQNDITFSNGCLMDGRYRFTQTANIIDL